jgi:hypothetical protein
MQSLELFGSALFLLNASLFLLDLSLALLLFQALPLKLFLNALFFFEFLYITYMVSINFKICILVMVAVVTYSSLPRSPSLTS